MSGTFAETLSKRLKNAGRKNLTRAIQGRIMNRHRKSVLMPRSISSKSYEAGAVGKKPSSFIGTGKKNNAIKGYGGKLSPKGISTYASHKTGNPTETGVLASGRRAPARGFGYSKGVANNNLPVGSRQVVTPLKVSTKFW